MAGKGKGKGKGSSSGSGSGIASAAKEQPLTKEERQVFFNNEREKFETEKLLLACEKDILFQRKIKFRQEQRLFNLDKKRSELEEKQRKFDTQKAYFVEKKKGLEITEMAQKTMILQLTPVEDMELRDLRAEHRELEKMEREIKTRINCLQVFLTESVFQKLGMED